MIAYEWKDIFQAIDDACIQRFNTLGRKVLIQFNFFFFIFIDVQRRPPKSEMTRLRPSLPSKGKEKVKSRKYGYTFKIIFVFF